MADRRQSDSRPHTQMVVAVDPTAINLADGYRLTVRQDRITLVGSNPEACFHALQTLSQMYDPASNSIGCCEVYDWPDFRTRGLLHDVTRGKVPTLATLKSLADRFASLKINQLQLYIEHAFTFAFDPDIAGPNDGLTPDEIRELDTYCHERFIDLVPAVASFGHMGRILSMRRYRHLAEIEPTCEWAELGWPERARGFTLDVANPQSLRLVEQVWSEILDAFSSPVVNICGDEPWDLGKGRNRERFSSGIGEAYIEHVLRTHDFCARSGRRAQVWSDVVSHYPELFGRLPRDLTVLHWGYDDRAAYDGTGRFVSAGLQTFVCPGTSGWKRIINAMDLAERNISAFAAAGKKHGASGLLNTDWGDHGHFNALACSWHGIALGAALGWRADHPIGDDFDARFTKSVLGPGVPPELTGTLRSASRMADGCETWRLFWQSAAQVKEDPTLPTLDEAEHAAESAGRAVQLLERLQPSSFHHSQDQDELLVACRFTRLFADKIRQIRAAGFSPRGASRPADVDWNDRLTDAAQALVACWTARNKPSGLGDILSAVENPRLNPSRLCLAE